MEQLILEKKAKTKCLAISIILSLSNYKATQHSKVKNSFDKWKNLGITAKLSKNMVSKMTGLNKKHCSVRYKSSSTILARILQKHSHKLLASSFKHLAASSVSYIMIHKSDILPATSLNASIHDIQDDYRSKTPDEKASRQSYNKLKVPYLPLQRDPHGIHPLERRLYYEQREKEERHQRLSQEQHNRSQLSGISAESRGGSRQNSHKKSGGKSIGNIEDEYKSSKHLSFIQYRENLMDKGYEEISPEKKPVMSEKTKSFLREFEVSKYLNQRKNKVEVLNKSDIGLNSKYKLNDESFGNRRRYYSKPVNNSFTGDENWNEKMLFKSTDSFLH